MPHRDAQIMDLNTRLVSLQDQILRLQRQLSQQGELLHHLQAELATMRLAPRLVGSTVRATRAP